MALLWGFFFSCFLLAPSLQWSFLSHTVELHLNDSVQVFLWKLPKDKPYLHILSDNSPFSQSAFKWMVTLSNTSFFLVKRIEQLSPGDLVIFIYDNYESAYAQIDKYYSRVFLFSRVNNLTQIRMGPHLAATRDNVYSLLWINSSEVVTVNKANSSFQMTPLSSLNASRLFIEGVDDTLILRTFNCSLFSEAGPLGPNGKPTWVNGLELNLFVEMMKHLKMDWKYVASNGYGNVYPNGTADGLHEDMIRGRGDLALCLLWLESEEVKQVDFLPPWFRPCLRFLVPSPILEKLNWTSLLKSYSVWVWISVVVVGLLMSFVQEAIVQHRFRPEAEHHAGRKLLEIIYSTFTMLTQTNFPNPSKVKGPLRPLISSWTIFSLLIATGYSCDLISTLTHPKHSRKINTVEDMVAQECHWGINTVPSNVHYFQDDSVPYYAEFRTRFVGFSKPDKRETVNKFDCYVELGESVGELFYVPDPFPGLYDSFEASTDCFVGHLSGFLVKKGSQLTGRLSNMVHTIMETGIHDKMVRDLIGSKRYKDFVVSHAFTHPQESSQHERTRLSVKHLSGPLYIWFFGMAISLSVFIIEVI